MGNDRLVRITNCLSACFLPPITLLLLLLLLLPYHLFRLLAALLRCPESVKSKVVVVSGASSGIGEEIAYQYAKRGAALVLAARREIALAEVAEEARRMGSPEVVVVKADVSMGEECRMVIEKAVECFGRIDILVTNAGFTSFCQFMEMQDLSNFTSIMDTNFWGSLYLTYYALPHLLKTKGHIVVIASLLGSVPLPHFSIYSASKAALISFYESLRLELGSQVTITLVTPGPMESEFTKGKCLFKDGEFGVDQVGRDVAFGPLPTQFGKDAAARIVDQACRRATNVVTPPWYWVARLLWIAAPGLLQLLAHFLYYTEPGKDRSTARSKRILDAGVRKFVYPESVQSPVIKLR